MPKQAVISNRAGHPWIAALLVLGLLVSLPVLGGGGWSKTVANYLCPPPVNSLLDGIHVHPDRPVFSGEPVNVPSASPQVSDGGKDSLGITALPNELVVNILAYLSTRDLLVCKRVCKNWQSIVTTVPVLACAAYRSCHPAGSAPTLSDTVNIYHESIRRWLNSFGEQGSKAITRLDGILASGGPHFPEQLFFAIASVLDEASAFACRKVCTIEHPDAVYGTCFSPDEQHFLSFSDRILHICSLVDGCWQGTDTVQQPALVLNAYFSPNSKYLVVHFLDNSAKIWALTDRQWQQADFYPADIRSIPLFNADTTHFVIVSISGSAHICRLIDGQWQPQTTALDHHPVQEACFHPKEPDLLATYCHNIVTLWRSIDGRWQQDGTLLHAHTVSNIRFSPDGNRLMTHSQADQIGAVVNVSIYLWHRVSNQWRKEAAFPLAPSVKIANFSPRGNYIVTAATQYPIEIWKLSDGGWQNTKIPASELYSSDCFSPDELCLATTIRYVWCTTVWQCTDRRWHREAIIETGPLRQTRFSPQGTHLVTISPDRKNASIWGRVAGKWREKAMLPHAHQLITTGFSPHGSYVLTTTWGNTVTIWTLHNKE